MAQFTANLNPQANQNSLGDLLKTSAYLKDAKRANQVQKTKSTPWTDKPMQSGQDISFTAGSGSQAPTDSNYYAD
jgi:hypothetical protein